MKSREQIDEAIGNVFGEAKTNIDLKYFGMTYAQGLEDALQWVLEEDDCNEELKEILEEGKFKEE